MNQLYDDDDIQSAALCAWKEARGEKEEGMAAVIWVLKHRVGYAGFANSLHDVIYGKNQFSSMSRPSDPEYYLQPCEGDEFYTVALNSAMTILNQTDEVGDETRGAHFYANLHTMEKGGWFERNIVLGNNHPIMAQIGHHTFFW